MVTRNIPDGKGITWIRAHVTYAGDDCLTWPFACPNGYGTFGYKGKLLYAHRFMCELVKGPPPSPKHYATHSCGKGHLGCCSPKHVVWKTPSENQLDRREHGTSGVWGSRGKLSHEQKLQIKALAGSMPQRELAEIFGVSRAAISKVIIRKSWTKASGVRQTYKGWRARVLVNGQKYLVGIFDTKEAAEAAYHAASQRLRDLAAA